MVAVRNEDKISFMVKRDIFQFVGSFLTFAYHNGSLSMHLGAVESLMIPRFQ